MRKKLEHRSYEFEVRADANEKGKIIEGIPIIYDKVTDIGYFDEVIEKGALKNADLTDVRFLVNHDEKRIPLARSRRNNGNSTMKLEIIDDGLKVIVDLDTENNTEARALYSAVERGDITGMSFMFTVEDDEWENKESEHPLRRVKKIGTVVEVSAVTFPAYKDTLINTRAELDSSKEVLEKAKEQFKKEERSKELELEKLRFLFFEKMEVKWWILKSIYRAKKVN